MQRKHLMLLTIVVGELGQRQQWGTIDEHNRLLHLDLTSMLNKMALPSSSRLSTLMRMPMMSSLL
jgi:hypothetical protein